MRDDASVAREYVPLLTRFGTAMGAGAFAALAASVPAATRIGKDAAGPFGVMAVWLALAGASLVPTIAAVAVLRGARLGGASFYEDSRAPRGWGVAIWIFAVGLALLVFGAALRATTHHHALAGATFALLGAFTIAGLAGMAARVVTIGAQWDANGQRAVLGSIAVLLGGVFVLFAMKVARTSSPAAALFVDMIAYFLAASIASRPLYATSRVFASMGPPIAAIVFVLGLFSARVAPNVPAAVHARAPLLTWPVDCVQELVRKR